MHISGALIKDWYAAAEPSCYVLHPILYIVGCLCKLIIAASCGWVGAIAYVHAYEENPVT